MRRDAAPLRNGLEAAVLAMLLAVFGAVLFFALWSLPRSGEGLGNAVLRALDESGIESPVTAVLMNFRGYDTLLELGVLFLALLGVWSFGSMPQRVREPPVLVLRIMIALLVPFLTLFAAYLLWAGSHAPGGAFQAGAVAGAAGVLIALSGGPAAAGAPPWLPRTMVALGLLAFVGVAGVTVAAGGSLLEYPQSLAKPLILLIEAAAAVSIGSALLGAFLGGSPQGQTIGSRDAS